MTPIVIFPHTSVRDEHMYVFLDNNPDNSGVCIGWFCFLNDQCPAQYTTNFAVSFQQKLMLDGTPV